MDTKSSQDGAGDVDGDDRVDVARQRATFQTGTVAATRVSLASLTVQEDDGKKSDQTRHRRQGRVSSQRLQPTRPVHARPVHVVQSTLLPNSPLWDQEPRLRQRETAGYLAWGAGPTATLRAASGRARSRQPDGRQAGHHETRKL
jgi:hypothetical protein